MVWKSDLKIRLQISIRNACYKHQKQRWLKKKGNGLAHVNKKSKGWVSFTAEDPRFQVSGLAVSPFSGIKYVWLHSQVPQVAQNFSFKENGHRNLSLISFSWHSTINTTGLAQSSSNILWLKETGPAQVRLNQSSYSLRRQQYSGFHWGSLGRELSRHMALDLQGMNKQNEIEDCS